MKELAIDSAVAAIKALATASNIYEGIALAAAVGIQYVLQRKKIQEQKFEKGGKLKKTLNSGGIFDGPSHANGGIPFSMGRTNAEVEGKEGYVINKKSMASGKAMTVTGTPAQISSAANVFGGGIDFAPGAKRFMYDYGGNLGMNMKAPVILPRQYINPATSQDNSEILETMKAQAEAIAAISNQILTLQVQLKPNTVTDYQKNRQKAINLSRQ